MKNRTVITVLCSLFLVFSVGAFELDYNAICDDDTSTSAFSNGNNNYSINGYKRKEESNIVVRHDPRKGKFKNEDNGDSGLKLEGVNKSDLEDLYYGSELLK